MSEPPKEGKPKRLSTPTPPVPEGMSKRAWKKELKKKKFEEEREEWIQKRKEKRKAQKLEKKRKREGHEEARDENGEPDQKKTIHIKERTRRPISVIVDCGFDDLMTEREKTSLASQIVRCYSENRKAPQFVDLVITSLNKGLRDLFEVNMKGQYKMWKDIRISHDDFELSDEQKRNCIYFSSDATEVIKELQDGMTYIIGGIVDKGRYKDLCKDKAEKVGLRTARLPIDEYIRLSGRKVLTTNHVFELLLKWLEDKDWKVAFESVLPERKLLSGAPKEIKMTRDIETDQNRVEETEKGETESENENDCKNEEVIPETKE